MRNVAGRAICFALLALSAMAALRAAPVQSEASPVPVESGGLPVTAPGVSPDIDPGESEWRFASRLTLVASYDDNIFIRSAAEQDDFLVHAAPSFAVGIGNFRSEFAPFAPIPHFLARTGEEELPHQNFAFASYTPDAVLFARHRGENAINHDVRVSARREGERWAVHARLRFQRVSEADIDVGRRIRLTYYNADAGADYDFTGRITGSVALLGNRSDYAGGLDSTETRATGFVDYQAAPKSKIGLGVAGGRLFVAGGGDQTYVQPLLRLRFEPTAKLSFAGQAGEEIRRFDSDIAQRSQFVFALSGDYAPSDGTSVNLAGRRETRSSAQYSGENIVATTYQGGVRQRFLRRNYLTLSGGFVRNDYENNQSLVVVSRRDNYAFGKFSASRDLTDRGTVELSFEHRTNDSSLGNFSFNQNVVSLAASFLY